MVWSCELDIYGRVKDFTEIKTIGGYACEEEYLVDFIPHRYQGQLHDLDTVLYCNRFRYFDPEAGQYTQQDPIGLAGGNPTLYGYVANPNIQIDPFGLKIVFRGERSSMDPSKVFEQGFQPKGTHSDLLQHVSSNTTPGNFISTSSEQSIAEDFSGKNGYVYEIETSSGRDVNAELGSKSPFPEQKEIAIEGGVKPNEIKGAHVMQNGKPTGKYIPNPNFNNAGRCKG